MSVLQTHVLTMSWYDMVEALEIYDYRSGLSSIKILAFPFGSVRTQ